jgi:hypothetical protein
MYIDPLVVPIYEPCGMHSGFNWNCEWGLWTLEAIMSSSKCEILQINDGNRDFLALQISIDEWWKGCDGKRPMSCDSGWGE